jgi:hypothetical protein
LNRWNQKVYRDLKYLWGVRQNDLLAQGDRPPTEAAFISLEIEKPDVSDLPPPDGRPTAREVYQQKIARNPKWRHTTKAGRGFIIGGTKPAAE